MFRNRFLILLGVSFLAASAALADDIGFIDCSKNADGAQVFAKPRRSPDVVASLPCGERFTILVYGFVFSRIQTSDGKVGFVYSSVIAVDRSGATVQQTSSPRMVTASDKVAVKSAPVAQQAQPVQAQPQPTPTQAAPAATTAEASASVAQPTLPAARPQPVAAQPAPAPASEPGSPASAMPAPAPPAPASNAPEPAAPAAQPESPAAAQPEPAPAPQPAAPAIRPAEVRSTWERRNPGGVRLTPLIEVFGGYAFARLDGGGGYWTNMTIGGMGSVGWNFKPWLQIVADSSYSTVTISGTKNVLYGNHFGPRYFYHSRNRWGITPFVEGLVGGSRADTTVPGVGGYTASANCISYRVGGGVDLHPSRRWEIRLLDVDYYRTSFGTNLHQNNYWASAGIVLRLFGGSSDY
ncbi:MAG: hypothetical protein AUH11_05655 [Acidobacteria bacterium 13_2_20CM_57_17]|nr:MAG: hypothetical protein AUH11_05655 [Acidobacteria bacterium 13_2_20CM_57_17]OLB96272.1 MAG: hypothetical protein AUI02_02450 [Acidobacteria bacterium 13_2_20CM_2_57_12]